MTTIKLLSAADLKSRFKKIIPFMSTEDTRYYLQGVYLEYENGNLKATATNGHILCTMEWDLPEQDKQEPFKVICPATAVKNLVKNITAKTNEDGGVLITVLGDGKKVIKFDLFEFKYEAQCIDGTFPDYSKVIPSGKDKLKSGMNAKYLISVLKALNNSPVDIAVDDAANAANQPHLFSSQAEDGIHCVIMPIKV